MAESIENKKKIALAEMVTAICKYVVGPVLAAALAGSYAHCNHQQSAKGYEKLAKTINEDVGKKADLNEARITIIEAQVPASQPVKQPAKMIGYQRVPDRLNTF